MDKVLLDFLRSHQLFQALSSSEIASLSDLISEYRYEASEYIFYEAEKADHFFILRSGALRATIGGKLIANIRPGEFFGEIAVLNESIRTGSVMALEKSIVIKIDGREIFFGNTIPVGISFEIMKELIKKITSLHYTNDFYKRTGDIIHHGENEKVEFKSSLRYNLHTGKFGREIEHAALKSIAAFLNSWGGILLIGVDDKGGISGLEKDQFENDDKALLHLTNMIRERLGTHFMQFVNCSVEHIEPGNILRVDVSPSNLPAYLTFNSEEYLYVRTGPSTTELKPSQIYEYIYNRFFRPRG